MAGFLESIGNFLFNSAPTDGLPDNGFTPIQDLGALGKVGYVLQSINPQFQSQYGQGLAQRQQLGNEQKQLGFAENADIRAGLSSQREGEAFQLDKQAKENDLKRQTALAQAQQYLQQNGITDPVQQVNYLSQIDPEKFTPLSLNYGLQTRNDDLDRALLQAQTGAANRSNREANLIKPLSAEGQLAQDYRNGLIDKDIFERSIAKKVAPTDKNYKQYQVEAASFADRMSAADSELGSSSKGEGFSPTNLTSSALGNIGLDALANSALSPDQQRYKNAADEWIRAKLRKESGAAIGMDEMQREYKTYFPQVGDSKEVIQQKASLRQNAQQALTKESGGAFEDLFGGKPYQNSSSSPAPTGGWSIRRK